MIIDISRKLNMRVNAGDAVFAVSPSELIHIYYSISGMLPAYFSPRREAGKFEKFPGFTMWVCTFVCVRQVMIYTMAIISE